LQGGKDLSPQDNKALVMRLFNEVFTSKNLSAADDIMAEEYLEQAVEPFGREEPGPVQGPSHARKVVAWLRAQFPDLEMTIESIAADADVVAVRVRSAGTNLGKLGGFMPPTYKRFVAEQSHWYRVADGQLCEHWATRDDLTAMLQMGVIYPPDRHEPASAANRNCPRNGLGGRGSVAPNRSGPAN
jgi:predicted ester cyclase